MKLSRLLLCSLFVLTGCNDGNNGIKQYKELPEEQNDKYQIDEADGVNDIVGKNAYLSYQVNKANPVDSPLPYLSEGSYGQLKFYSDKGYADSNLSFHVTDVGGFAKLFGESVLHLYYYNNQNNSAVVQHQIDSLTALFKKMFANSLTRVDEKESFVYEVKVNRFVYELKRLNVNSAVDLPTYYNSDFANEFGSIIKTKQSEATISNFLRKYGVGVFDYARYASYDFEFRSYRVRYKNHNDFMSNYQQTNVLSGATMDDYYHLTSFNEETNSYDYKLFSYEILPFTDATIFPKGVSQNVEATTYFREVYNQFVAKESQNVLKGENKSAFKPKVIKDLHYQLDNMTSIATFSSLKPYKYEYSLNDSYKSYNLDKLKELGYKKMYIRPATYIDQITSATKITFEITVGDQKVTVFNKKQLVKTSGVNQVDIPWYELDFEKVLASDRKVSCTITPSGTKARIPLVQFEYAYAM